jgi:putative peptidoglycan lipid II flippase
MTLTIKLAILSFVNLGVGVLLQSYVLLQVGPGSATDALFAGMTVPQLALAVVSGSLMHVLVPLFSVESEERLRQDAWSLMFLVAGFFGALAAVLYVTAPAWVPLTVPGFDAAAHALTVRTTRVQLIGMIFVAVNGVQWASYHARQQFLWAEVTPIVANAVGLCLLVWALPRHGVMAAAWITTFRIALQTLLLAPGVGRPVLPDLRSDAIGEAWRRIRPLLVGTACYKTDPLLDRFLLSMAGSGTLSLYYLAQQVYSVSSQVLNRVFIVPLVPALSRLHLAKDTAGVRRVVAATSRQVIAVGLTALVALAFVGRPLLGLLAEQGRLLGSDMHLLWLIMLLMSGQFVIGSIGMVMTSRFYAMGDTRSPTKVGIAAYAFGAGVKVVLFYLAGVMGLAAAVSLYYLISLAMMSKALHDRPHA